ncbi:MAG: hypothetical protein ACRCYZ_03785 [Alphaproteobacteria bacterium]
MQHYLEKKNVVTEGGYFSRYLKEALSIQEEKRKEDFPELVDASQPLEIPTPHIEFKTNPAEVLPQ